MLNQFTLYFQSKKLEQEYRVSEASTIRGEFNLFAIQSTTFLIFYVLYYFQEYTWNGTVLSFHLSFFILIIIFWFIINHNPQANLVIFPLLQIIFVVIWNLDTLFPTDTYDENYDEEAAFQYNWYYGFQAFYFHFAILMMGYHILPQFLVLIGVYLWLILFYPTNSVTYISLVLTFTSIFIGVYALKYSNERMKRIKFIEFRERNKWMYIVDKVLDQSILVLKMNIQQDQLQIQQINQKAIVRLKITNDLELRQYLRNTKLSANIKFPTPDSNNNTNLESMIRSMIHPKTYSNFQEFKVFSNVLKQKYKVKLVSYVLNDQNMVIVVFEEISFIESKELITEMEIQQDCFQQAMMQMIQTIKTNKDKSGFIQQFVQFQLICTWLGNFELKSITKQRIDLKTLCNKLMLIYRNNVKIICNTTITDLYCNPRLLLLSIIGVSKSFGKLKFIKLKIVEVTFCKILKISFITENQESDPTLINKLNSMIKFNEDWQVTKLNIFKLINKLNSKKERTTLNNLQLVSFLFSRYIFWYQWKGDKIEVKQKIDSCRYNIRIVI